MVKINLNNSNKLNQLN